MARRAPRAACGGTAGGRAGAAGGHPGTRRGIHWWLSGTQHTQWCPPEFTASVNKYWAPQ